MNGLSYDSGVSRSAGFTLVELVISLSVAGLLIAVLAQVLSLSLTQVPKDGAKLAIENRLQLARYWITRDANSAESYSPGSSPQYGTFAWKDYSGPTASTYQAVYYYDPALKAVMRQEKLDGVVQSTFQIAADILAEGDSTFVWSAADKTVTVSLSPTILEAPALGDLGRTSTLVAYARYESETIVAPPGATPVPTPIPGSVSYYVAADPTIFVGTLVSGNAVSLQNADSSYYSVASSTGASKDTDWEVVSQALTSPSTIGQVEVRFTGKTNKQNSSIQFFVKRASGYPSVADSGFTFTQADTEVTHSFFLDPTAVPYIDSTELVYLEVKATATASFTLDANQVLFIASP